MAVLLVGSFFLIGCKKKGAGGGRITLTYYKLYDEEDVIRPVIEAYQKAHANVSIRYRKFTDPEAYEDLILNELAEGEGPDIFEISNASLPRFFKKIKPLASEKYTPQLFRDAYVSVVTDHLIRQDPTDGKEKIYGIPLSVDTPVLYYNKKVYESKFPERGKPAALWGDITQDAALLREEETVEGESVKPVLLRGGFAFGRADNIQAAADIVLNLMLQEGVSFYDSDFKRATFASAEGERVVEFYTSFADPKRKQFSWDETMVSKSVPLKEIEAFLGGKVSAIIGYSDLLSSFEVHAKNLKAKGVDVISVKDIGISSFPQNTDDLDEKLVAAKYMAQTVSRTSKNSFAAWDFLAFLSSRDQVKRYLEKTKKPSARRDLLENQKQDPELSPFVSQIGYAQNIPFLHERKFRMWLSEAIQKVSDGGNAAAALQQIQEVVNASMSSDEGLFPEYIPKKTRRK